MDVDVNDLSYMSMQNADGVDLNLARFFTSAEPSNVTSAVASPQPPPMKKRRVEKRVAGLKRKTGVAKPPATPMPEEK